MNKFYYEMDKEDWSYAIVEKDGGCEHGAYYDVVHFWVQDEGNAADAVTLLNKLYKKVQEK